MAYGRNRNRYDQGDIEEIKEKISQQMPGVDIDNIDQQQMKKMVMDQIKNNPNINQDVKDKINKGDIEGLKKELIQYLDSQNNSDGSSQRLSNMLKNNDFDALKGELMGMLLNGMNQQKKKVNDDSDKGVENTNYQNPLAGLFDETLLNGFIDKIIDGNKNDKRIVLLNSIKPFISDRRQKAVDDCVKVMNIITVMERLGFKAGS